MTTKDKTASTLGRRSTGLRNKYRKGKGRGPYSLHGKGKSRDTYGQYDKGKCVKPDVIVDHVFSAIDQASLKAEKKG